MQFPEAVVVSLVKNGLVETSHSLEHVVRSAL
jgi:hypothetical protein